MRTENSSTFFQTKENLPLFFSQVLCKSECYVGIDSFTSILWVVDRPRKNKKKLVQLKSKPTRAHTVNCKGKNIKYSKIDRSEVNSQGRVYWPVQKRDGNIISVNGR